MYDLFSIIVIMVKGVEYDGLFSVGNYSDVITSENTSIDGNVTN